MAQDQEHAKRGTVDSIDLSHVHHHFDDGWFGEWSLARLLEFAMTVEVESPDKLIRACLFCMRLAMFIAFFAPY